MTGVRLIALEAIIAKGMDTFREVGLALTEIRDSRLYREKYATFEDYCRERWGISKPYATQLIQASNVAKNLVAIATIQPTRESHLRPLTGLAPEQQREVWQEAVKTAPGGKVTAKHVEVVRDKLNPVVGTVRHAPAPFHDGFSKEPTEQERFAIRARALIKELAELMDSTPAHIKELLREYLSKVKASKFKPVEEREPTPFKGMACHGDVAGFPALRRRQVAVVLFNLLATHSETPAEEMLPIVVELLTEHVNGVKLLEDCV